MSSFSKHRLVSHPHQSLYRHLSSVDEVSERALRAKVLGPQLFAGLDAEVLRRLLVFFHDFGKGTDFFQWMITQVAQKENASFAGLDADYAQSFAAHAEPFVAQIGREGGPLRGHAQLGAFVVQTALPADADPLLRAIVFEVIARHHGNLRNFDQAAEREAEAHDELLSEQWKRMNHGDYRAILADTGLGYAEDLAVVRQRSRRTFFTRVFLELSRNETLLPYLQTVFLFSLLLSGDKGDLMLPERTLVGRGRRCNEQLIEQFKLSSFGTPSQDGINQWREEAYQRVAANLLEHANAGFYSITLPTGMGKTLTAYNAAIQLQNRLADRWQTDNPHCIPRIIYCLPFTSVIDQNAAILEKILALDPDMVGALAKHHYLADWPEAKDTHEQALNYSEKEYLVEGWEYTLTVTTFVQLLHTVVSNRNRQLRKFHNLANAVVVLDEVQSIPPKYFNLVSKLFVALHEQLGTRFVFVTATQPFLMNPADGYEPVELTDPTKVYTRLAFERMNRIDLDVRLWQDGPEEIAEQTDIFARAIQEEADSSFLIILNLVRESQAVYHSLAGEAYRQPNVEYLYLSSAILPVLRREIIERVKHPPAGKRIVLVSTQVVEAGVDIDLDVVYRAFAPLDSINQSAGRCNRNMRAGWRGSVRLFKSKGAKDIYDVVLLEKTERTLKKQLSTEAKLPDGQPGILPEARFYEMNQTYMHEMRRAVADGSDASRQILEDLYRLNFEKANAAFQLIPKTYETFGVFIDDPQNLPKVSVKLDGMEKTVNSSDVYQAMQNILQATAEDRWERKRQLRLLRPALLQYVVQIPTRYLPEDLHEDARARPFIRMGTEAGERNYARCYNLITGYFLPEAAPNHQSF